MLWLLAQTIVWLFDVFVFMVVMSIFLEVVAPGRFETIHKIYKTVIDFEDDEEL